jgi:hypothetical protein
MTTPSYALADVESKVTIIFAIMSLPSHASPTPPLSQKFQSPLLFTIPTRADAPRIY